MEPWANERWDAVTKVFHWCIATAIAITAPVGYVMSTTYGASFKDARALQLHLLAAQIHHTLGILVLATALIWIVRRLVRGRPAAPIGPWYARSAAGIVHFALLLLLVLLPLTGWAAISALADSDKFGATHLWFFSTDHLLPRIWQPLPFDDPSGYAQFAQWHIWGLWTGLALVSLHLPAALWHHWVRRDSVLRRMWPLAGP